MKLPIQLAWVTQHPPVNYPKKSYSWRQLPHCTETTSFACCLLLSCSWRLSKEDESFFFPYYLHIASRQLAKSVVFFSCCLHITHRYEQNSLFFFPIASTLQRACCLLFILWPPHCMEMTSKARCFFSCCLHIAWSCHLLFFVLSTSWKTMNLYGAHHLPFFWLLAASTLHKNDEVCSLFPFFLFVGPPKRLACCLRSFLFLAPPKRQWTLFVAFSF